MNGLFATALLILVATITPGPNNLIVMRQAARSGIGGALPAIAGILMGGLLLLTVVAMGAGGVFLVAPGARAFVAICGCLYIAWLGATLLIESTNAQAEPAMNPGLPTGTTGLILFQFVNPKSWMLTITVVSTMPGDGMGLRFLQTAGLFLVTPGICLLLWSSLGYLMRQRLAFRPARTRLDRAMGSLLIISALFLLSES